MTSISCEFYCLVVWRSTSCCRFLKSNVNIDSVGLSIYVLLLTRNGNFSCIHVALWLHNFLPNWNILLDLEVDRCIDLVLLPPSWVFLSHDVSRKYFIIVTPPVTHWLLTIHCDAMTSRNVQRKKYLGELKISVSLRIFLLSHFELLSLPTRLDKITIEIGASQVQVIVNVKCEKNQYLLWSRPLIVMRICVSHNRKLPISKLREQIIFRVSYISDQPFNCNNNVSLFYSWLLLLVQYYTCARSPTCAH